MDRDTVKVVGYVRVSTENQVKYGYSLGEQKEEIKKFCNIQNYNLLEIFSDEGVSGAKADEDEMTVARDGLLDMLVYVKEMGVRYIVVLSTSRLWRSDMVRVLIHRELKKSNVDVKAIDRPQYSIYTQNPNEVLVNGMLELLDVYERLEIALKLKRGRIQKAKGGGYAGGGVPYGYDCPRGSKRLLVNQKEAQAVRKVFQLKKIIPNITLERIACYMNQSGYTGRNGKDFNPMLVKRILDREDFYKGEYEYGGIKSIGDYEPILAVNQLRLRGQYLENTVMPPALM